MTKDSIPQQGNRLAASLYLCLGTHHEEVQPGEGNQVDGQLAQVSVQLPGEAQAAGHARHHGADEVVQVAKGGGGQLQGPEADVVQGLQEVCELSGSLTGDFDSHCFACSTGAISHTCTLSHDQVKARQLALQQRLKIMLIERPCTQKHIRQHPQPKMSY